MISLPADLLHREAERFGTTLDETAIERLNIYASLLVQRNKVMNLTAITDKRGMALKHFADSLSLFGFVSPDEGSSVIDVGTGAGFPGLVLLISRPDIRLTLLDSTKKKLSFISDVLNEIGLSAELLHARAEEAGQNPLYREKYDLVTARAVANLRELSEYCLPFARVGGVFAAMKGAKAAPELNDAQAALRRLGGQLERCVNFEIEDCGERSIIIIKKASQTLAKYPRIGTQIAKHPLVN